MLSVLSPTRKLTGYTFVPSSLQKKTGLVEKSSSARRERSIWTPIAYSLMFLGLAPGINRAEAISQISSVQELQDLKQDPPILRVEIDNDHINEVVNLLTTLTSQEDGSFLPEVLTDHFLKNPVINTHRTDGGENKLDLRDNIPLILRMYYVDPCEVPIQITGDFTPEQEARVEAAVQKRLIAIKETIGKVLDTILAPAGHPLITEDDSISKEQLRAMLGQMRLKANDGAYVGLDADGASFLSHLDTYIRLFDKTDDDDLWFDLSSGGFCEATYNTDKDGKVIDIHPSWQNEIATSLWNSFLDEDIQKIFTGLTYKESRHLVRFENDLSPITAVTHDFDELLEKYKTKKEDQLAIPIEDFPMIQEAARWVVASMDREEFVGYKSMNKWFLQNGIDDKKFLALARKYYGVPQMFDLFISLAREYRSTMASNELAGEMWFRKQILPREERIDIGKLDGDTLLQALKILKIINQVNNQSLGPEMQTSYSAFLDDPKYYDFSNYRSPLQKQAVESVKN